MILLKDALQNLVLTKLSGTGYTNVFKPVTKKEELNINTPLNRIIASVNTALLKLHTRFMLKERQVVIQLLPMITLYHLSSEFAQTNNNPDNQNVRYIRDTPMNPFTDDVIKVLTIDSDNGIVYDINKGLTPRGIYLPNPFTIQITDHIESDYLGVIYQANHEIFPLMSSLDETIGYRINLHPSLLEAFYCYTASECLNTDNTQTGITKKQILLSQYEDICSTIENKDPINQSETIVNIKPILGGWI